MKKRGLVLFVILSLVFILSYSVIAQTSLRNFNSNTYLISGAEDFVMDISNLDVEKLNIVKNSLSELKQFGDIKDYFENEKKIFIKFEKDHIEQLNINDFGISLLERYPGYIIEFKSSPVLEKKVNLEEEIGDIKNQIKSLNRQSEIEGLGSYKYNLKDLRDELEEKEKNVNVEVLKYKRDLKNEHSKAIEDINDRLQKDLATLNPFNKFLEFFKRILGISSSITGSVILENEDVMEFSNTFNGAALRNVELTTLDIEKIRGSPYVQRVSLDWKVTTSLMDSVPLIQNGIGAGNVSRNGEDCQVSGEDCLNGEGITIAIIDTGVDYTHPSLGGCFGEGCRVAGGYDFVNNDEDPMDDQGHGTHCAATAAGKGVLNGVAPDATVYAYKVLNEHGSGSSSNIIASIERAVDPNQDGDFSDHLDIISLSLGGGGNPDGPMSQSIDNAVNLGVVAVIAAGNSGPFPESIGSPGTARNAITVGAIDKNNNIAEFSSRGPVLWDGNYIIKPDIVAPGVDICAAQYDEWYEGNRECDPELERHIAISGTSMATPHVAGMAALIMQANPNLNAKDIKSVIKTSAEDLGNNYCDGADVDRDGAVEVEDLKEYINKFQSDCRNIGDMDLALILEAVQDDNLDKVCTKDNNLCQLFDINDDNSLSPIDYQIPMESQRDCTGTGNPNIDSNADLNGDGYVNYLDREILLTALADYPIGTNNCEVEVHTQGNGKVNVINSLKEKITIDRELGFGMLGSETSSQKIVSIKNIDDNPVSLTITILSAENEDGDAMDVVSSSVTTLDLDPGESSEVTFDLTFPLTHDGYFTGKVLYNDGEKDYLTYYTFSRYSKLELTFDDHYPNYYLHNSEINRVYGSSQGWDFLGGSGSLLVRSGNYIVYTVSDFVDLERPDQYPETDMYYLYETIDIPIGSVIQKSFSLDNIGKFIFKAESFSGEQLNLYEWQRTITTYKGKTYGCDQYNGYTYQVTKDECINNPEDLFCDANIGINGYLYCNDRVFTSSHTSHGFGDREIYIQNKPDNGLNTDIGIKYWGSPKNE